MKKTIERIERSLSTTVGIRVFKSHLGRYTNLLRSGRRFTLTDRGRILASVIPYVIKSPKSIDPELDRRLEELERVGFLIRGSGKPMGAPHPIKIKGGPISDTVLEDRR